MKKIILGLGLIFLGVFANAQNGLENIIVEKYYISNANDASVNAIGGVLPVGSITYRVYADMLPGYKFQAAYGVPTHQLKISTTTFFFNNIDRGATTPTYTKAQAAGNTIMLDSWLSVGAACSGNLGVLKSEDNGVATVVNADGVLLNNDSYAGIPLSTQDGMVTGSTINYAVTTLPSINAQVSNLFGAVNSTGNTFQTNNGSWANLTGSIGPNANNKVLIGQFTTDGIFSFELNIQIGTPTSGVQKFVAKNPASGEISIPSLTYINVPPSITQATVNLKAFIEGFYLGFGTMNASIDQVLYPTSADTLTLQLASSVSPYSIVQTSKAVLSTSGLAQFSFPTSVIGGSYYLVARHRNALETWSANPISISTQSVSYDFSNAQSKAYGNNLSNLQDGSFGLYSGDISDAGTGTIGIQDGVVESQDYSDMENAVSVVLTGYITQDITGDNVVESADYSLMDNNVGTVIFVSKP